MFVDLEEQMRAPRSVLFGFGAAAALLVGTNGAVSSAAEATPTVENESGVCAVTAEDTLSARGSTALDFYEIELVPTGKIPGTGRYTGTARVTFADSPFDVAVANDGTFRRRLTVDMTGLKPRETDDYVVWVAPPNLDGVKKLGPLGEDMVLTGEVALPKFLVIISLEEQPEQTEDRWNGPIVHRGMSRSGFMHSMAGHGPFSGEPCESFGFR